MNTEPNIVDLVEANMALAFESDERLEQYLAAIESRSVWKDGVELSPSGREKIASAAYRIARKKTAIDAAGKEVKDDAQKRVDQINAMRRKAKDRLEALQAKIREPLTRWEEQEKARVDSCNAIIERIKSAASIRADDTSTTLAERIAFIEGVEITESDFQGLADAAFECRVNALLDLRAAHDRAVKQEAEAAELERLRAEQAARDAEAREREERERAEKEAEAERQRIEREKAEAAIAAAERAKQEAEERAAAEIAEKERAHQAELDRIKAEQARAERERLEKERSEREAREAREAEDRRRQEDEAHRSAVMRAAKEALMEQAILDEGTAKRIVLAVKDRKIPHVSITF